MTKAPKLSPARHLLPIALGLILGPLAGHLAAQERVRIAAQTPLLKTPEGPILGRVERGLDLPQGRTDRKAVEVTIEGWIFARSLGPTTREGFNAIVNDGQGQNIRATPDPAGKLIGRWSGGALLQKLETQNGWAHVKRTAWVARLAVVPPAAPVVSTSNQPPANPAPTRDTTPRQATVAEPSDGSRATAPHGGTILATPGGNPVGTLTPDADLRVLTRANGWSRVRVDAWIPDSALEIAEPGSTAGVTAAEVRSDPARWIGQVVIWKLQVVAVQVADNLRPELPEGKPYLLTRGPLPESGFVYVLVNPTQAEQYRNAPPLREITARVRIRAPASRYLPTPVVELIGEQ